jgi:hypothetical protein
MLLLSFRNAAHDGAMTVHTEKPVWDVCAGLEASFRTTAAAFVAALEAS